MDLNNISSFIKKNNRFILLGILTGFALIFIKKYFFISFFILANYFILWLKYGYGFDSPLEIISFGTFMCSYVYGTFEALIVAGSSLIAVSLTGRMKMSKIVTQLILVLIAFIGPLFRNIQVSTAGLIILGIKYSIDITLNLLILHDSDYLRKIPQKLTNILFWVIIYLRFGNEIVIIMKT